MNSPGTNVACLPVLRSVEYSTDAVIVRTVFESTGGARRASAPRATAGVWITAQTAKKKAAPNPTIAPLFKPKVVARSMFFFLLRLFIVTAVLSPMLESDRRETADNLDRGRVLAIVAKLIFYAAAQHAVRSVVTTSACSSGLGCPNGIKRFFETPASRADRRRLVGGPAALHP